jgi:hypothetical protein
MAILNMGYQLDCAKCNGIGRRSYPNTGGAYARPGGIYGQAFVKPLSLISATSVGVVVLVPIHS